MEGRHICIFRTIPSYMLACRQESSTIKSSNLLCYIFEDFFL